jgi:glycosyltransferase involved in cell wall biosynthesis
MKVAIITHHFPPGYNAGAEQYAYRVAKMLLKMGHQVEVVCIESISEGTLIPVCKTSLFEDILVHRLYFNLDLAPNPLELKFRNPALGLWVKEYLQRTTPDIVHFNSGYLIGGTVIEAAYEIGIPSVLTLHEYWFLCPVHTLIRPDGNLCETLCSPARCAWCYLSVQRRYRIPDRMMSGKLGDIFVQLYQSNWFGRWTRIQPVLETIEERRRYLKSVLGKVDIIISPSRFLIQKYYDFGLNEKKITYLPFGLDTTHLTPEPSRSPSEVIRIGYLGQYANHKGVHILIEAFNRLNRSGRKCNLTLFGKLTDSTAYGKRILKSIRGRENITCAGRYDNAQVGDILSGLDLIVVPSIWFENRPTIIVEALAMKTPVVASKIGGIVELIEDEKNGLLCEAGNVAELARQLQRFLDDPALQPRLREGIQPVIRTEEEMEELLSLYSSLLPDKEI